MAEIHITLQGKGGVGKSAISALVAQKLRDSGKTVKAIDTDPVNATLSGYQGLHAVHLDIMDDDEINTRHFDTLVTMIVESNEDAIVIDNGAASFVALAGYLKSNMTVELLKEMGHEVTFHTVITAGQAQKDTLIGFSEIATAFEQSGAKIIVWLNEFWGKIQHDGKPFEEMRVYKENKKAIHGVIVIPELKPKETYGGDFSKMLSKKLTFDEAIMDEGFNIIEKNRLKITKKRMFTNMSAVF